MKEYPSLLFRKELSKNELAEIIKNAKRNDDEALTKLCEYVYSRIYTYIYYRVIKKMLRI